MAENETPEQPKQTLGQRRVRVGFNPSKDNYIDQIKVAGADFMDLIDGAATNPNFTEEQFGDFKRLKATALTAIEEASMWAVKMATV